MGRSGRLALVALPALLLAAGCPLRSDYPLSDPAAAIVDTGLAGEWRTQDPESGEWRRLTFLPFDARQLVAIAPGDEEGSVDAWRAFTTEFGGERFLNLRELGGDEPWYFARYRLEGGRLALRLIDDGLAAERRFGSSAELGAFIQSHLSDPLLYGPTGEMARDMVWERIPD